MRQTAPIRLLLLLFFSLFALALTQTQRYEFKHSFRAPFYLGRGGTLPFWEFGGSAIVSEDRIRLTPAVQSRVGWVWNSVPVDMDTWEVQMDFEIGGGGSRGADGLALWYVAEPKQEGIAMGSKEHFQGMAIFFDTFDNNGQNDEPKISLWVNDGTQRYDPFDDGSHGEKGSCKNLYRDSRLKVRVVYRDGTIQVETDGSGNGNWAPCITHRETLPKGFYFGLSAATGHLIDNHDVYSFITYNLDPWRRRSPAPVRRLDGTFEAEPAVEQQRVEAEPVKPVNPYLPQDPPNPYLPQQEVQQPNHQEEEQFQQEQNEHHQQQDNYEPPPPPFEQQQHQQQQQQQQEEPQRHEQPQQQQPQQQPQQQQQRSPEDLIQITNKLEQMTSKLEAMRNQQDNLAHSVSQVVDKVNGLQQQQQTPPDVSGDIRSTQQEVRNLQSSITELRRLVQDDVNQLGKVVTDIKNHISTEQGNTYNNVARLVRELQQHVGSLQTLVERGDREQNSALQELKSSKEELKTVVEQSGSVAWWVYFAFFQVCFGVAFVLWRKAREDANKKFL